MEKLITLAAFVVCVFVFQFATVQAQEVISPIATEKTMPEGDFIDAFHNVKWGTWKDISDKVSPYFLEKNQKQAVDILEKNNFSVSLFEDFSEIHLDRTDREEKIDAKIIAQRGPGWKFWRIRTDYKVYLSIKNDKVIRVTAVVDGFFNKMP